MKECQQEIVEKTEEWQLLDKEAEVAQVANTKYRIEVLKRLMELNEDQRDAVGMSCYTEDPMGSTTTVYAMAMAWIKPDEGPASSFVSE